MSPVDIVDIDEALRRAKNNMQNSATVEIIRADTVKAKPITWLWPFWLACGKFHLLAGAPGTGKTTLTIAFAATITIGGKFPDASQAPIGSVLIWSGEDDLADSIVPRFLANGGDPMRLHFVGGKDGATGKSQPFDPATDFPALIKAAKKISDLRLLIVDPVVSAVPGDSHKNAEVRRGLQPLFEFAAETGAAVLGISHFTKGTNGRDPVERVTGSLAFAASPRLVMVTAKPVEQGGRRRLVRAKSNIGPDGNGFEYDLVQLHIADKISGQAIAWGQSLQGTARELLAAVENEGHEAEAPARADAVQWLSSFLESGPLEAIEIARLAKVSGRSMRTVERAKALLRVKSVKNAMTGRWSWALPKHATDEDRHTTEMAAFEKTAAFTEGRHVDDVAPLPGNGALGAAGGEVEIEI